MGCKALRSFFLFFASLSFGLGKEFSDLGRDRKEFVIGVLQGPVPSGLQQAFDLVQDFVNSEILPDLWNIKLRFAPNDDQPYLLREVTGYGVYQIAESLDAYNVSAIIGPGSSTRTKIMHPYAASKGIPHLAPFATDPALGQSLRFPMLIRLSPPDTFQTAAVLDFVQFIGWDRVSLITTENDYGFGVESALTELASAKGCKVEVIVRFKMAKNAEDIPVSKILDRIVERGPHPVVVVTDVDYGKLITKKAYSRGMTVTRNWLWVLMDGVAVDEVLNVTYVDQDGKETTKVFNGLVGTRPVMSEGALKGALHRFWNELHPDEVFPWQEGFGFHFEKVFDAIISVSYGLHDYIVQTNLSSVREVDGNILRGAILRVSTLGMSSKIAYYPDGKTKSTEYDILLSSDGQWIGIGEWSVLKELNLSYTIAMNYSRGVRSLIAPLRRPQVGRIVQDSFRAPENLPIINVVTILEPPFVILGVGDRSGEQEELANRAYPNDLPAGERKDGMDVELHGYCIDLLQKISELAGLRYTLRLVDDSLYGGYDEETGEWNGMINDVIKGRSHAAVAPITVTGQRAEYVEFTTSFMDIGLKFIVDRNAAEGESASEDSGAFAFLLPFHQNLYLAIALAVFCLAVVLNLLSRLSPFGTRGHFFLGSRIDQFRRKASAYNVGRISTLSLRAARESIDIKKLRSEREDAERAMGFNNALYFAWASLFWQTPERVPRAPCARFVTAIWYLAAVVFVASYTANMVAFVSSKTQAHSKLDSISELASQTKIKYGTVSESSVEFIFASSGIKIATQIYDFMMSDPQNLMVPTSAAGMERVHKGTYALLWDSLVLDFEASKADCRLKTVDAGFGGVVYALALPKSSPLTSVLSRHILQLKESGYIETLWKRYFIELDKCIGFGEEAGQDDFQVKSLDFYNLAGVFYVVAIAMGIGLVILFCEWIFTAFFDVNKNDENAPQSVSDALKIRFRRLKQDVVENWLPHPIMHVSARWSRVELPSSDLARSVVAHQLEMKHLSPDAVKASRRSKVCKLRGYSSETDLPLSRSRDGESGLKESKVQRRRFSLAIAGTDSEERSLGRDKDHGRTQGRIRRNSLSESLMKFSKKKSGRVIPDDGFSR